ncbi:MAG TPA: dicarboxylate/amino acid:cation symporter [Gemmatimonadales bacterium]|nr:dicarboxylate/amino acid:cation symporter [Gemmatimonadales bacterium]
MSPTARGLVALAAGMAVGAVIALSGDPARWQGAVQLFEAVGSVWINAILMTVIPLIAASLVVSIGSAPDQHTLGRVGGRALAVFLILLVAGAVITSLIMPVVVQWFPSGGLPPGLQSAAVPDNVPRPSFTQWIVGLVPSNPIKAGADGAILPIIVFMVAFGLALTRLQASLRLQLLGLFEAVRQAMLVILGWVVTVAPVGIFALALAMIAKAGVGAAGELGAYILMAVVFGAVATLALYPVVRIFGRVPMGRFARAVGPGQAVGFTSHSSLAALPTLLESARTELKYSEEITGFCLPFAAATFKYSAPIASISSAYFVSHLYGIPIPPASVPTLAVVAILTSFSVPGVGGGAVLGSMGPVLLAAGMPAQAIGVLFAVDPIPNSVRTVANVTGYLASSAIVAGKPGTAEKEESRKEKGATSVP